MTLTSIELNPEIDHQFNKCIPENEDLLWTKARLLNLEAAFAEGRGLAGRPVGTAPVPSVNGILTCAM